MKGSELEGMGEQSCMKYSHSMSEDPDEILCIMGMGKESLDISDLLLILSIQASQ